MDASDCLKIDYCYDLLFTTSEFWLLWLSSSKMFKHSLLLLDILFELSFVHDFFRFNRSDILTFCLFFCWLLLFDAKEEADPSFLSYFSERPRGGPFLGVVLKWLTILIWLLLGTGSLKASETETKNKSCSIFELNIQKQ